MNTRFPKYDMVVNAIIEEQTYDEIMADLEGRTQNMAGASSIVNAPPAQNQPSMVSQGIDFLQRVVLVLLSFFPRGIGALADAINAIIYMLQGKWISAGCFIFGAYLSSRTGGGGIGTGINTIWKTIRSGGRAARGMWETLFSKTSTNPKIICQVLFEFIHILESGTASSHIAHFLLTKFAELSKLASKSPLLSKELQATIGLLEMRAVANGMKVTPIEVATATVGEWSTWLNEMGFAIKLSPEVIQYLHGEFSVIAHTLVKEFPEYADDIADAALSSGISRKTANIILNKADVLDAAELRRVYNYEYTKSAGAAAGTASGTTGSTATGTAGATGTTGAGRYPIRWNTRLNRPAGGLAVIGSYVDPENREKYKRDYDKYVKPLLPPQ